MDAAKTTEEKREFNDYPPVCAIYTGGTVGIIHENDGNTLRQASLEEFIDHIPQLKKLKFDIHFYSYKNAIDSSNIKSNQWKFMARFIDMMHTLYQGFVIIHGVNTMAYTASALSFMLKNVSMPIVLTGAEYPLTDFGSDAAENLVDALNVAGHLSNKYTNIPMVSVLFGKKLFSGTRATKKVSLDPADGFYSPNYPVIASLTNDRIYGYNANLQSHTATGNTAIEYLPFMKDPGGILICDIYPDMDMDAFEDHCKHDGLQSLILRTYGTGGIPDSDKKFMSCIKTLIGKNVLVVSLTQCPIGEVEYRLFETNAKLFYLGVVNGGDMITEAAYCKVKYLLAKYGSPKLPSGECGEHEKSELKKRFESISKEMSENQKGEMSINTYVIRPVATGDVVAPNNPIYYNVKLPDLNAKVVCSAILMLDVASIEEGDPNGNADVSVVVDGMNILFGKYKQKIPHKNNDEQGENQQIYPITMNATDELRKLKAKEEYRGAFTLRVNSLSHKLKAGTMSIVISARVDQNQ